MKISGPQPLVLGWLEVVSAVCELALALEPVLGSEFEVVALGLLWLDWELWFCVSSELDETGPEFDVESVETSCLELVFSEVTAGVLCGSPVALPALQLAEVVRVNRQKGRSHRALGEKPVIFR